MMKEGLITIRVECPKWGCEMQLSEKPDRTDGFEWRCRKQGKLNAHDVKKSLRGTWFESRHLSILQTLKITRFWYGWCMQDFLRVEVGVHEQTVVDSYMYLLSNDALFILEFRYSFVFNIYLFYLNITYFTGSFFSFTIGVYLFTLTAIRWDCVTSSERLSNYYYVCSSLALSSVESCWKNISIFTYWAAVKEAYTSYGVTILAISLKRSLSKRQMFFAWLILWFSSMLWFICWF